MGVAIASLPNGVIFLQKGRRDPRKTLRWMAAAWFRQVALNRGKREQKNLGCPCVSPDTVAAQRTEGTQTFTLDLCNLLHSQVFQIPEYQLSMSPDSL